MNSREPSSPAGSAAGADGARSERFQRVGETSKTSALTGNGLEGLAPEDELHLDQVARAVQQLLAGQARRRLSYKVAEWPALLEDADDICQLAAIAFVEAYRAGRIAPDAQAGVHMARSVAAYAWGICSRIFSGAVRRSRPQSLEFIEKVKWGGSSSSGAGLQARGGPEGPPHYQKAHATESSFEDLLTGPGDDDSRLWDVLRSVEGRCAEKDIIVTYLLASGASYAEVRAVLGLSENVPANAVKRVGRGIREILGLGSDSTVGTQLAASAVDQVSKTDAASCVPTEEGSSEDQP